jgi:hypothetical protein
VSHDTDKLIRQLSLVAFLMAERRPLTARDIKSNVEGYQEMSDEAFEEFVIQLGGGERATVEGDRARAASRLSHTTRGIADYFAMAAGELNILEERGYNPSRPDVARQLSDNHLPSTTVPEYRHMLRELGARVGQAV